MIFYSRKAFLYVFHKELVLYKPWVLFSLQNPEIELEKNTQFISLGSSPHIFIAYFLLFLLVLQ